MKNLFLLIISISILISCDKKINITQPTILIQSESSEVFDTIQIRVIVYAEIDGGEITPDYFSWSIMDNNQNVIYSNFQNSSNIKWIPDSAGSFVINVKIGYDQNKSITTLKEITIKESTISLQKKLIGTWTGNALSFWDAKWQVDLSFDEFGHYIGKGYNLSYENGNYMIGGPFHYATYIVDYSVNLTPSENVPCNMFVINNTTDNKGYGRLSVSQETKIANVYSYDCYETHYIDELEFINSNKRLRFTLKSINSPAYEWEIKYDLTRIE